MKMVTPSANTTSTFRSLAFKPLMLAAVAVCVAVSVVSLWTTLSPIDRTDATQQSTLVLAQQVDQLASLYLSPHANSKELGEADRKAVESWLLFDKKFASSATQQSQLRFELATTLRRIGFSNMLLGNELAAIDALNDAAALFAELQQEEPTNISLVVERAGCYAQHAQLLVRQEDHLKAMSQCDQALDLLQSELHGSSEEWDDQVKRPLSHLAQLYISLGEQTKATQAASVSQRVLERIIDRRGPSQEDNALLHQALRILQTNGSGS